MYMAIVNARNLRQSMAVLLQAGDGGGDDNDGYVKMAQIIN